MSKGDKVDHLAEARELADIAASSDYDSDTSIGYTLRAIRHLADAIEGWTPQDLEIGVNIGFKVSGPKCNTARAGEPGFYVKLRPKPGIEAHAALVQTPCSHALFESPEHALTYAYHPGDLPVMVGYYLRWLEEQDDEDVLRGDQ